jgi:hypothetical protein
MDTKKWRGLKALVQDAVEHGSRAIEQVHLSTAQRPFAILEALPGLDAPTRAVHRVHDVVVQTTYEAVRLANRSVGTALGVLIDALEEPGKNPK